MAAISSTFSNLRRNNWLTSNIVVKMNYSTFTISQKCVHQNMLLTLLGTGDREIRHTKLSASCSVHFGGGRQTINNK